jgi:hypothetical protein
MCLLFSFSFHSSHSSHRKGQHIMKTIPLVINEETVTFTVMSNVDDIPTVIEKIGADFVVLAINHALRNRAFSNWQAGLEVDELGEWVLSNQVISKLVILLDSYKRNRISSKECVEELRQIFKDSKL